MKTICIYHSIDLDGWMSAAIVKHWWLQTNLEDTIATLISDNFDPTKLVNDSSFYPTKRENNLWFFGYNYGQPIPDLSEYDEVIMCDVSFPKEDMLRLNLRLGTNFIWIDHHQRTIDEVNKYIIENGIPMEGLVTEPGELSAACELTWKYFMSNPIEKFGEIEDQSPMPEIVRLLGMYDSFRHKGTDEEQKVLEFQYGARSCISNYEEAYNKLSACFHRDKNEWNIVNPILEKGKAIYQYLCTEAKQTYKNGFKIKFWVDAIPTDEEIRPIPATGICDICGKNEDKQLIRYYFRYENDKCDCHSPYHFDVYDCCQGCKPVAKNKVPKRFICINKERFNPINFGIDYHKDGYDGCACFHYSGVDNKWHFSLYNDNGKVDVSIIAKQYGGGGHKGAAGFVIDDISRIINNR